MHLSYIKNYPPHKFLNLLALLMLLVITSCGENTQFYEPRLPLRGLDDVSTGLRKVNITTPDSEAVTSREQWMRNTNMTIYDTDGTVLFTGSTSIKGRGNSTWGFPKKPYALKLDKKSEILGMPKHKRWCLLANWVDRTLMRNEVAFEIARQMPGLDYTPRGEFVELFLNGIHQGNYYLCEHIKVDGNRVDVAELDETVTTGLGITGGYLFELDSHLDEQFTFVTDRRHLPWQFKDPDEVNPEQYEYGKWLANEVEDALYDDERFARRDFAQLLDLPSFIDWWFVHELTLNVEPQYPNSCFMHKDIDTAGRISKLKAGPVWDFDYYTFNPDMAEQYSIIYYLYYPRLMQDAEFRKMAKERWETLRRNGLREHICQYIDQLEDRLAASDAINSSLWPCTNNINADNYLDFHNATSRLKTAFTKKFDWLDNKMRQQEVY